MQSFSPKCCRGGGQDWDTGRLILTVAVEHLLPVVATRRSKQGEQVALLLGKDEGCVPGFRVDPCRFPERLSHARARADLDAARTQVLEQPPRVEEVDGLDHPGAGCAPR